MRRKSKIEKKVKIPKKSGKKLTLLQVVCTIGLEITSGYGNKTVYGPKSDCCYYTDISKRAENKFVKSYP
jgi:hypothetical protein